MSFDIKATAEKHREKLSKIKIFLTDVDGVLTTGHLYWSGEEVGFNRFFHTSDGYGLKMLMRAGLKVGIITGGNSLGVKMRAENLKLDFIKMNNEDKRKAYLEIQEETGARDEEILYIGDEFFDIPLIKRAGFGITVPQASLEVKETADYITHQKCGHGCVREVVDMLRYVQGIVPKIEDF